MNEQESAKWCQLWSEARNLAQERGLDMQLTCPLTEVCPGTTCVIIEPEKDSGVIYNSEPIIGC